MKVYGPYVRKDGRKHVIIYNPLDKTRRTQSYPRFLMEKYLGETLPDNVTVDHINGDFTDDRIENYQLISLERNISKSAPCAEIYKFVCPVCKTDAEIPMRYYKHNQINNHKKGPYCSRECAGWANAHGF